VLTRDTGSFKKRVILLTDGAVSDPRLVINHIEQKESQTKVFVVGIGDGASRYLVRESAIKGDGDYTFVTDANLNVLLEPKMIDIIQKSA